MGQKKIKVNVKKSHLYSFLSLVVVFFSQSVAPVLKSLADNWRNHRIVISCSRSSNFSNQIALPSSCKQKTFCSTTKKQLNVPEKPKLKCLGFTYNGAKLFNMLPIQMKKTENPNTFKTLTKD